MPDSALYVKQSDSNYQLDNLTLHIKNAGSIDSKIVSIKIDSTNVQTGQSSQLGYVYNTTTTTTTIPFIVKAGQDVWVNITKNSVSGITITPSKAYKITVYTDAGGSYFIELTPIVTS